MRTQLAAVITSLLAAVLAGQSTPQHPSMPPGMMHEEHQRQMQKDAELERRGAAAMGFDQNATTHHFHLAANGGAIEVRVNDPLDRAGLEQVRSHLHEIAAAFTAGDFAKPLATHGEVPPGVAVLREHPDRVRYVYEETPAGGRVRIVTDDAATLSAIHDFLRYQISEHATGDPLTITS